MQYCSNSPLCDSSLTTWKFSEIMLTITSFLHRFCWWAQTEWPKRTSPLKDQTISLVQVNYNNIISYKQHINEFWMRQCGYVGWDALMNGDSFRSARNSRWLAAAAWRWWCWSPASSSSSPPSSPRRTTPSSSADTVRSSECFERFRNCFCSHQLAAAGTRWRHVLEQLPPPRLHLLLHGQVQHLQLAHWGMLDMWLTHDVFQCLLSIPR